MKKLVLFLSIILISVYACNKEEITPKTDEILVNEPNLRTQNVYDGTEGDQITFSEGEEMIERWRNQTSNCNIDTAVSYNFIGKDILNQLLNQSGVAGISFYYALDSLNRPSLVYVGTRYDDTDVESLVCDRVLIGYRKVLIGKGLGRP